MKKIIKLKQNICTLIFINLFIKIIHLIIFNILTFKRILISNEENCLLDEFVMQ